MQNPLTKRSTQPMPLTKRATSENSAAPISPTVAGRLDEVTRAYEELSRTRRSSKN